MKDAKLEERLKVVDKAIGDGKKVVFCVAKDRDSAQFRYRCLNLAEATEKSKKWCVIWLMNSEAEKVDLGKADLLVVERQTAKDDVVLRLVRAAQAKGVKVVFDLDDLIFDLRDLPILMRSTNSRNVFYWAGYFWGVRRIAKRVDGFIATNEFLAGKLKRSFGKPVGVIPNSLNHEQVEASEKALKKKGHDGFVVGYFSGSPTHARDFALAEGELIRFLQEYEDVNLRVVGYMEFSAEMREWIDAGRVEVMGPVDYLELQKLMAEVDVNIAPLTVNDFTNCKSELKFFEAAVVETTTVASPTYAFRRAIKDGENGYLAQPGEWYDKLEYLYRHPKENRKVALAAKKYALKNYYGTEFLREAERAYDELKGGRR